LGADTLGTEVNDLAGSEYLQRVHRRVEGSPKIDIDLEKRVQRVCREAIDRGLITSAHDCSEGGLAVALAECSIQGGIGFTGEFSVADRWDVTEKALRLYRDHPKLPTNAVTREMALVLESRNPDLKIKGAREQQGLILMYRAMTAGPMFVRPPEIPVE